MGYFSNGTEGAVFSSRFCEHCVNWRDLEDGRGPGCPVFDAHLLYAYELCNAGDHPGKVILDMLIERTEDEAQDGYPAHGNRCAMFQPSLVAEIEDHLESA